MGIFGNLFSGGLFDFKGTLGWPEVQKWISTEGNAENLGVGYANLRGRIPTPMRSVAELRKEICHEGVRLHVTIIFDPNQGPARSRTWEAAKLDSTLEKMFGHNLRVQLKI